jgi:hypothetical protein
VTVPFHSGAVLHPKIVKQLLESIEEAGQSTATEDTPHKRAWTADPWNTELMADFSSETIVNFGMARHRSFRARRRGGEDPMTTPSRERAHSCRRRWSSNSSVSLQSGACVNR